MIDIRFYCDERNKSPVIEWLQGADDKLRAKIRVLIGMLSEQGHQLDRPHAEYVSDNIYALRIKSNRVQYRVFYFFHGQIAAVLTHEIVKKTAKIPPSEIARAINMRNKFVSNPFKHTLKRGIEYE